MPRLILGSASPRRAELLAQIGVVPAAVRPADIDEAPLKDELPRRYCMRIAQGKAKALAPAADEVILCADTTVAVGRRILGKPDNAAEAMRFLRLMSGRRHKVVTCVVVRSPKGLWAREVVTTLKMSVLTETQIEAYIATGDWQGKAGGYGIQGPASAFIPWIQGSYTGVVGLPLAETAQLLRHVGVIS